MSCGYCGGSLRPYSRFSRPDPYFFFQVAPQLYSRGRVDPVAYSLLLWICSQELWPLDHRGVYLDRKERKEPMDCEEIAKVKQRIRFRLQGCEIWREMQNLLLWHKLRKPLLNVSRLQWPRGLRHELSSPAPTPRLWGMDVCVCVFCVRLFCVYIVSSETTSRPNKRLIRTYYWISLFMSYIQSAN
jgi:hypothetical protein